MNETATLIATIHPIASGNEITIPLNAQGVYIVVSENRRVKVVNY